MYENILAALSQPKPTQQRQLTIEERSRNYRLFDELMEKGVSLDDLLRAAEGVAKPDGTEAAFTVMEEAVREDPGVAEFRRKAAEVKAQIITEVCLRDDRYRTALGEYRKAVADAYVRNREEVKSEDPMDGRPPAPRLVSW